MFRLLTFLSNYRNAILFIVLEGIAFYLIVHVNEHQRHLMGDAILEVSGAVHRQRSGVNRYFRLGKDNDDLMAQNDELHQQLEEAKKRIRAYEGLLGIDSIMKTTEMLSHEQFKLIPSRVIKNTVDKNYNYIMLDKGEEDGVKKEMGVISPSGVVGTVIRVSKNYSLALSALNVGYKLVLKAVDDNGAEIGGNVGVYEWDGKSTRHANLTYIPETVELKEGYKVVTSGYSTIFPEGCKVGVLDEINDDQKDGFHNARIQLSTDFYSLGNVYILDPLHKTVLDSLEIDLPQE